MAQEYSSFLWVEKYRPEEVKHAILPAAMKAFFTKIINNKDVPNMLFFGGAGVGKTSVAKALCKDVGADFLYINASNAGIDTLRTDIEKFAHVKSLQNNNGVKIVILDELDSTSSHTFQAALRADIEKFHKYCRFLLTTNYVSKIIDPLRSRCQEISFNFSEKRIADEMKPKILKRLLTILTAEKVLFEEETIKMLVDKYFPDIRRMINLLQQYSNTYKSIDKGIFSFINLDDEFYQFILKKELTNARKYLLEKAIQPDEVYRLLFDNFVPMLDKSKQSRAILIIAEKMYQSAFVIDKEITLVSALLELIGL